MSPQVPPFAATAASAISCQKLALNSLQRGGNGM